MATKVSLGFANSQIPNSTTFDAMTGNATYPTPPVTMANLKTAQDDFTAKMAAAQTGGIADTAAENNSRQALLGDLRRVATYVPMTCNDDPALLLSSGFQTPSTNRASTQSLDQKRRVGSTGRDDRSGAQREHVREAHAWWLNRLIRLERSKFAYGDVAQLINTERPMGLETVGTSARYAVFQQHSIKEKR